MSISVRHYQKNPLTQQRRKMDSIFISGIPKGLDQGIVSRRIKKDIETVAQVRTISIHQKKGFGFVSLYDETSTGFVLGLNEKICINGNALRIMRRNVEGRILKTKRQIAVPTCQQRRKNDAFVFKGYDTYTNYKRHRLQTDVLYQYIQHSPQQKKLKRKPWKDVNRLSQLPSPKSRKTVEGKRRKCRKQNTRQARPKESETPTDVRLPCKKLKRRESYSNCNVACSSNIKDCLDRKDTTQAKASTSHIKTETCSQSQSNSIYTPSYATVHVYDHSKRVCSIEVDNDNVLESIQVGLKNKCKLPSADSSLISYNGKTVSNQWQPKMANDDNIHIVVKGRGGMMQGDPPDKEDNGHGKNKTTNNDSVGDGTKTSEATGSKGDVSVSISDQLQKQTIQADIISTTNTARTEQTSTAESTVERCLNESKPEQIPQIPADIPTTTDNTEGREETNTEEEQEQHIQTVSIAATNNNEGVRNENADKTNSTVVEGDVNKSEPEQIPQIPADIPTTTDNIEGREETNSEEEQEQHIQTVSIAATNNNEGVRNENADKTNSTVVEGDVNKSGQKHQYPDEMTTSKTNTEGSEMTSTVSREAAIERSVIESVEREKENTELLPHPETDLSPFVSTFSNHCEEYQTKLIEELDLGRYFPNQLTYESVMAISDNDKDEADTLAELPRLILRKLIMLDFTARENDLNTCLSKLKPLRDKPSVECQDSNASLSKEDVLSMFDNDDEDIPENSLSNLDRRNPAEIMLSIFLCLHPTMKQKICLKMFACHLAIPIIFPLRKNEHEKHLMFSMWPLRSITVNNNEIETSIVNCKQNIVSIVRLGRPQLSKSKLANELLYDTSHNAFFNYDCILGSSEKQGCIGLVEAAWFLPSPKQPRSLKSVTVFLNLRGDASNNAEQLAYLKNISRVMIIVTDTETMKKNIEKLDYFKRAHFTVLFLLTGKIPRNFIRTFKKYYIVSSPEGFNAEFIQVSEGGQNIGLSEIKEAILNIIGPLLNQSHSTITLQKMCDQARLIGITVDEDIPTCKKGRTEAKLIFDKIKNCPLADIKVKYTPLQTKLWQEYTDAMKKYRKPGSDLHEKERLVKKMHLQRTNQWKEFKKGKPFIKEFIALCSKLDSDILVSFLASLKFEFDEKSRSEMPNYRRIYATEWSKFQSKQDADKTEAKQAVRKAEQRLSEASFGVEHIFRELGQIYEASLSLNECELGTCLAKAVAKSITLGYPFELMDGDVANVPLNWVEQIFRELKHILGDKKLLTLSILGLQSSGKSTLLNAMFGLTFSVSAGRCTRGIYLQLLPVQDSKFKFDYVLVVDTEGLRAPELGDEKYQHDNELATLVLGMADITIVNIKGENTSEVKDILQICVHAFLRLKMANQSLQIRQSCIFIHQNVSDIGAKDSMIHARKKLDEVLDKMTVEAAEEENISDIKCFKDVIKFDSNDHVWYFSDLWKGDPPMAPANPGYSRDVREVKSFIFRTLAHQKPSYLNISDTFIHIKDLWNGILANDFVFSFRNSLEIRSYNALENIYQDLIWKLELYTKELIKKAETEMKQCTAEYEKGQVKDGVCKYTGKIKIKHQNYFQENQMKLKENLKNHFEKSDKKDEIAKWKHGKLLSWDVFTNDCLNKLRKTLTDIESNCRVDYEMNTSLEKSKNEIYDQASNLAEQMKDSQPSIPDMEACFNEMWSEWIEKTNIPDEEPIEINVLLDSILFETFTKHKDVLETEMKKQFPDLHQFETLENSLNNFEFNANYISVKKSYVEKIKDLFRKDSVSENEAIVITNIILKDIDLILRNLEKTEWKFNATEVKEIPKRILKHIDRHNNDKDIKFTLLEPYKAFICTHVFSFALPLLKRLDTAYRSKFGMKAKLANHKDRVWRHFQDVVNEKSITLIACDRFCEIIRDHVEEAVRRSLPDLIFIDVVEGFGKSKSKLMKDIMKYLVKEDKFDMFISYILDPYTFAFNWLSDHIDSKCFGDSNTIYTDRASEELQNIFSLIKKGVDRKPAECLREWLENVNGEISQKVCIQMESFRVVVSQKITDLDDFIKTVKKDLVQLHLDLKNKFKSETKTSVKWLGDKTPLQLSMDKLWGCRATCPFCKEPCQWNNQHSGKHSCIQHRASGVRGRSWYKTNILVLESCSFEVQTNWRFRCGTGCKGICTKRGSAKSDEFHPCKEYYKYFPDWNIHPCSEISSSKYWEWFFCTYNEKIATYFGQKKATIPGSWRGTTKDAAISSLNEFS